MQKFLFSNAEPGQINGLAEVYFNAQYLWCKQDYIPEFCVSGCEIKNITPQVVTAITVLINAMDLKACKAKVDYPCRWLYKVVGSDEEQLSLALAEIIDRESCHISPSNSSRTGKYICLNVEVPVKNEKQRNSIYMALKAHPKIIIVL